MAFFLVLISCLSLCAHALPRLFEGVDRPGGGALLLDVDIGREGFGETPGRGPPRTRGVDPALILPAEEVIDEDLVTLPVVRPSSQRGQLASRDLPVEDGEEIGALVTLPVIHSKRQAVYGRDLEIDLAKRADVAYYAQSKSRSPLPG